MASFRETAPQGDVISDNVCANLKDALQECLALIDGLVQLSASASCVRRNIEDLPAVDNSVAVSQSGKAPISQGCAVRQNQALQDWTCINLHAHMHSIPSELQAVDRTPSGLYFTPSLGCHVKGRHGRVTDHKRELLVVNVCI